MSKLKEVLFGIGFLAVLLVGVPSTFLWSLNQLFSLSIAALKPVNLLAFWVVFIVFDLATT